MRHTARPTPVLGAAALAAALALATAGCGASSAPSGTSSSGGTDRPTAADAAFVRHMLPHHVRALQVGALMRDEGMRDKGADARVTAFGRRILAEQTPERERLASWVGPVGATPSSADAAAADGYVTDAEYARLQRESGRTFERDALLLSARSETGAAAMSQAELTGGRYAPARMLATSISGAPQGEIPELRRLAASLG